MDLTSMTTLEYEHIRSELSRYAVSYEGKRHVAALRPMTDLAAIRRAAEETEEAKELLERGASIPVPSLDGMEWVMSLLGTGYLFNEQDLTAVGTFLNSCTQLRKYMRAKENLVPRIAGYAASLYELPEVRAEIERCIRYGVIDDGASKGLEKARKRVTAAKERLHRKMETLLSKHRSIVQENLYSVRNGRYVIPVKREYHKTIKGSVLDQSTSGQTVFVEPEEIGMLQTELALHQADEAREEALILGMLSALLEREREALERNVETTGVYDFIVAKARLGLAMHGSAPVLNADGKMEIREGRHPLLEGMVPLSIAFGEGYRSLILTGPNTGGKTVVLKTLGLLALMAQSGLLVPAEKGSRFAVFQEIRCVIGDGQSLAQSLSTFSAQMLSIREMLDCACPGTLLLIDELAAGTDPGEGIALSIAILEELNAKRANVMVTTHYNELKSFASATPGFRNARMEFDPESLRPLYRLTIGEAGSSYALQIAERLGLGESVLARSRQLVRAGKLEAAEADADAHGSGAAGGAGIGREDEESRGAEGRQGGERAGGPAEGREARPDAGAERPARKLAGSKEEKRDEGALRPHAFEIGDAVWVTSLDKIGIIYELPDARGMVGVRVQKQKLRINRKRLKPYLSKEELYPEDYDLDIVLDSKENRKKRKLMRRKHVEGLTIVTENEDDWRGR